MKTSVHKAGGLDFWSIQELRQLPEQAYQDLAQVLHQVEREGVWPAGLSGAVVALLPKKEDHGPMAQRPISLLPVIYRVWAAARGSMRVSRPTGGSAMETGSTAPAGRSRFCTHRVTWVIISVLPGSRATRC